MDEREGFAIAGVESPAAVEQAIASQARQAVTPPVAVTFETLAIAGKQIDPVRGLIRDEANDEFTPEQLFLTAVDDALEQRRAHKVDKLIRQAGFPIPDAAIGEIDYREGRGITPVRMRRYADHDWRADPMNLLIISPTGGGKPTSPARSGSPPATTSTPSPTPAWTNSPDSSSSPAPTASRTASC